MPTTAWRSDECITYSVGFRAPRAQELGARFLDFLHDRLALEGMYADAGIAATRAPARIPTRLRRDERSMARALAMVGTGRDADSWARI